MRKTMLDAIFDSIYVDHMSWVFSLVGKPSSKPSTVIGDHALKVGR